MPSPLRSIGSKKRLIQKHDLMKYFPRCVTYKHWNEEHTRMINHRRVYVELFCGSAITFFNLDPTPTFVILNDINHDIFNFWNVIATQYDDFIKELKYTWIGQDWLDKYEARTDDVSRAIAFYIRNRRENIIDVPMDFPKEPKFEQWKAIMDRSRLKIWNLDYKDAMAKLNKMTFKKNDNCMEFLLFEDPPYAGQERFYGTDFNEKDHEILANLNHESTHDIIITYGDNEYIRELYSDWYIVELKNYTTMKWKYNTELLLSNHPLTKRDEIKNKKGTDMKLF